MPVVSAVAQSLIWKTGVVSEYKFGHNPDVDVVTVPEDIWSGGGTYIWPAAAAVPSIVSTSLNDANPAGTGMRQVRVVGLNAAFAEIQETINLNGVTPVVLSQPFFRVNRMFGVAAGSVGWNVGTITLSISGSPASIINPTRGQTLQSCYTVPALPGISKVYITSFSGSITRQQTVAITLIFYSRAPGANQCWRVRSIFGMNSAGSTLFARGIEKPGVEIAVGTDIRATCTECTTNDTAVSADYELNFVPI